MAWLLVDLHRSGVYWGDCSLANTLFRRDGDRIQAFLVDAETSEIHPALSDGQRGYDLDILVENVAFGLADLGALQGRPDAFDDAVAAAETVRRTYGAVWSELTDEPLLAPDDRHAVRARIRRLNDLGFAVDEISLVPSRSSEGSVRLRVAVANRRFHAHELQRLTGIVALEGQAKLLLNDLREYRAWLERAGRHPARPTPKPPSAGWTTFWSRVSAISARRSGRVAIRSRPTATSSRRNGSSPRWPGRTWAWRLRLDAYLGLGAPAPEDERAAAADRLDVRLARLAPVGLDRRPGRSARPVTIAHAGPPTSRPTPSSVSRPDQALRRPRRRGRHRLRGRARGEVFGLLGPNGAGKTTTVEILEGLRVQDGGTATVLGLDVATSADALKPRIGVSLQTAAMYPKLTVTEVVDLFRSFYVDPRPTEELIDALELGERRNARTARAVRGPAPATGRRPGPRERPRAGLPRRADDGPRPGRPPLALGPGPRR